MEDLNGLFLNWLKEQALPPQLHDHNIPLINTRTLWEITQLLETNNILLESLLAKQDETNYILAKLNAKS